MHATHGRTGVRQRDHCCGSAGWRLTATLVVAASAGTVTGCRRSAPGRLLLGTEAYEVTVPASWEVDWRQSRQTWVVREPHGGLSFFVGVHEIPAEVSADAAIHGTVRAVLRDAGPQLRPVIPLPATVSGRPATLIRFADNRRRPERYEGVHYYVRLTRRVFAVGFAYPLDQKPARTEEVQEIIRGVVLRDGGDPARPFLRCEPP